MSDNPYQSPMQNDDILVSKSKAQNDIRSIAIYQKVILGCILANLSLVGCQFAQVPILSLIAALAMIGVGIVSLIFVILLALKVYHPVVAILLGLFSALPCIGLLALLIINGRATETLQKSGLKVGLLGAKIPRRQ